MLAAAASDYFVFLAAFALPTDLSGLGFFSGLPAIGFWWLLEAFVVVVSRGSASFGLSFLPFQVLLVLLSLAVVSVVVFLAGRFWSFRVSLLLVFLPEHLKLPLVLASLQVVHKVLQWTSLDPAQLADVEPIRGELLVNLEMVGQRKVVLQMCVWAWKRCYAASITAGVFRSSISISIHRDPNAFLGSAFSGKGHPLRSATSASNRAFSRNATEPRCAVYF